MSTAVWIMRDNIIAHLALAVGLAGCSASTVQTSPVHLGYGTPGVSAYVNGMEAMDFKAMAARCSQVPQAAMTANQIEGLPAACAQLQRTAHNQPGNAVQPNPVR